jgi:hypothetical protein
MEGGQVDGRPGGREETDSLEDAHPDTAEWVIIETFGNA